MTMLKDQSKAKILLKGLKQNLEIRGYTCVDSTAGSGELAEGYAKLTVGAYCSISIINFDADAQDIFGNDVYATAPLRLVLNVDTTGALATLDAVKIMVEVAPLGITVLYGAAATLAGAEDVALASRTEIVPCVNWPNLSM